MKIKFFALLYFLLVCKFCFAETTYYVSSSYIGVICDGTIEQPYKKISDIKNQNNCTILLKRGDVFYESISNCTGLTLDVYGKGDRPVLCGFLILNNPSIWESTDVQNVWRIDLTKVDFFRGKLSSDKTSELANNVGFLYDAKRDKVYGHKVQYKSELTHEGDFFTSELYSAADLKSQPFQYVYFYSKENPKSLGSLCFCRDGTGISQMKDCQIRNISVVGYNFGMTRLYNTNVEGCQIDLIGGCTQINAFKYCRLGNGIELWVDGNPCHDVMVKNCLISRTFDCGTTIQGSGSGMKSPYNIHIVNNRFYKCRQAFEHFLKPTDNADVEYINCEFKGNICYKMGENEFDSPEARDACLLSYESKPRRITIRDNTFWGGSYYDGYYLSTDIGDNIVYLTDDKYIHICHYVNVYNNLYANDNKNVNVYQTTLFDNSKINIHKETSWSYKRKGRRFLKDIAWNPCKISVK